MQLNVELVQTIKIVFKNPFEIPRFNLLLIIISSKQTYHQTWRGCCQGQDTDVKEVELLSETGVFAK